MPSGEVITPEAVDVTKRAPPAVPAKAFWMGWFVNGEGEWEWGGDYPDKIGVEAWAGKCRNPTRIFHIVLPEVPEEA